MKLFLLRRREQGNILLASIAVMLICGMALVGYLALATNHNQLVMHTQVWNATLPTAEAGIEDALNHCAWNYTNWVSNGWTKSATNSFYRTNALREGGYWVNIYTNPANSAAITVDSTGYFPMPGSSACVPRKIRVTAVLTPAYKFAMLARSAIEFKGNGTRIDSYNSNDPLKSTFGLYDPLKAGDKADVGCMSGKGRSFDIGNGNIWGHVYMGAGGSVLCGSNGKIGDVNWQTIKVNGVEAGWTRTDLNVTFPNPVVPFASAPPPTSGSVDGNNYDYVLGNGTYQLATLDKKTIASGKAILWVTGLIDSDLLVIRTNATLQIYCSATDAHFDSVQNYTQRAGTLEYFGLPSNKTLEFKKNYMGVMYAPYVDLVLSGGNQIYGCVTMNSYTLKGGADVHFDEAVATQKPRGFVITSWNEL